MVNSCMLPWSLSLNPVAFDGAFSKARLSCAQQDRALRPAASPCASSVLGDKDGLSLPQPNLFCLSSSSLQVFEKLFVQRLERHQSQDGAAGTGMVSCNKQTRQGNCRYMSKPERDLCCCFASRERKQMGQEKAKSPMHEENCTMQRGNCL